MREKIELIFHNLDKWRHLPAYQLERRADVFYAVYLPEILAVEFKRRPFVIIPEFPIHIPAIDPGARTNLSYRIDYLVVFKEPLELAFVELKTDPKSRRAPQDKYLMKAQKAGMEELLHGLQKIYEKTTSDKKYDNLLTALSDAGLIVLRGGGDFESVAGLPKPKVIYVQPNEDEKEKVVITFKQVADLLSTKDDFLSQRFAESLREWSSTVAGESRCSESLVTP